MFEQNSTPDVSSFQTIFLETLDESLSKYGRLTKNAAYRFLEEKYNVRREDITLNIRKFVAALEQMFGPAALLIEIDVMKNMQQKIPSLKLQAENAGFDFAKYLESAKYFIQTL